MDKNVYLYDATNDVLTPAVEPGAVIQNSDGTSMPRRKNLRFVNANVEDDAVNDVTIVTTSGWFLGDVSNLGASYTGGKKKVTLHWTDPDDLIIEGAVQATWGGTLIVRKEGSIPSSNGDGTVVVNSTVKNQYATTGFVDTGIEYDTEYYYRAFPYTTKGLYTNGSYITAEVPAEMTVFGVEWDGTASSSWTRTDGAAEFADPIPLDHDVKQGWTIGGSSPFDSIMPWSGMQIVEDNEAGTLVSIPKYYYKWTRNNNAMKLQISNDAIDGFLVSPAHADRGDGQGERDVVYVGAYHCAETTYKSTSNVLPAHNDTISDFRTNIHNLGTTIWQWDYAMYWTVMMLYLVEFADWNTQDKIGAGCSDEDAIQVSGLCDTLAYHTAARYYNGTYGHTKYRNIEDLWGNVTDVVDGIYFATDSNNVYCIKAPADFGDDNSRVLIGTHTRDHGFFSKWTESEESGFEYAILPYETVSGSTSTYFCDYSFLNSYDDIICVGADKDGTLNFGGFHFQSASHLDKGFGSRLMKLS